MLRARAGPAIIAAAVAIPLLAIGVPLAVTRLKRARAIAYRIYERVFDVGKFKVIWVNYA